MKPQTAAVRSLLRRRPDGITSLDALYAGCGSRLAARVAELRHAGYDVTSTYETTDNGARVVRYRLVEHTPAPVTGVQLSLPSDPHSRAAVPASTSAGTRSASGRLTAATADSRFG